MNCPNPPSIDCREKTQSQCVACLATDGHVRRLKPRSANGKWQLGTTQAPVQFSARTRHSVRPVGITHVRQQAQHSNPVAAPATWPGQLKNNYVICREPSQVRHLSAFNGGHASATGSGRYITSAIYVLHSRPSRYCRSRRTRITKVPDTGNSGFVVTRDFWKRQHSSLRLQ